MAARGCRIISGIVAVVLIFVAFSLTIAAFTTPQWQVANMEQVNQLRYIGLYQTCTYGSRQGPQSPPQWVCTFISYGEYYLSNQFVLTNNFGGLDQSIGFTKNNQVDYVGYGGESWRLSALILLVLATFLGFIAFVFQIMAICIDASQKLRCLVSMSGAATGLLFFATLFCLIAVLTFAINSQQNQNLYILELTAFSVFQLGNSFYIGIAAMVFFIVALIINIGATVLICLTAKRREEY